MAKPATLPVEPSEEEDISRTALYDPPDDRKRNSHTKGKERDLSDGFGMGYGETTELVESPTHSSYPPVNDEEAESRRVQETLKRWEAAELQRRKTARMSSSTSASASPSLVDNVSRRATLLLSGGRSHTTAPSRKSNSISSLNNPSLGAHARLPTNDTDGYGDNDHVPLTAIPASPTPSPSRSASDVSTIVGRVSPPLQHLEDDPFNPLEVRSGVVGVSPFADPLPAGQQTFEDPANAQTSALLVPVTPKQGSFEGGTTTNRQPPPALPLGLPPPVTPPPPIPIDSPTVESTPQSRGRQQVDEDEEDGKRTRWWHEWLCGCGEGKDRGGDNQAGRTNPFE